MTTTDRDGTPEQQVSPSSEEFTTELRRLKRRGCCLLVTGSVNERVRAVQSRHLFGDAGAPRQRVLTLTDATPVGVTQYLPAGIEPEQPSVTVLDHTDAVRGGSTADTSSARPAPSPSPSVSGSTTALTGLGATLYDALSAVLPRHRLAASELRVGVATLDALMTVDGLTSTQAFVRAMRTDMQAVRGMGHVHLSGSLDADTRAVLRSVVDIHLELRESQPSVTEQRWHLLEANITSDWLSV